MYHGTSSIPNKPLMKLWSSPSDFSYDGQDVEEGLYGSTSIVFAEYFVDVNAGASLELDIQRIQVTNFCFKIRSHTQSLDMYSEINL